jgi:hypothetical protein
MKIKVGTGVPKHLLEEMEKDKPSAEPEYWAKSGCRYCYGTGTIGVRVQTVGKGNTIRNEELCICASKKWQQWQEAWFEARKAAKRKEAGGGNGTTAKPKKPNERALAQVRNLDERRHLLWSKVHGLQRSIDELPHHETIKGLEQRLAGKQADFEAMFELVREKEQDADAFDLAITDLQAALSEKRRQVAALRQEIEEGKRGPLEEAQAEIDALTAEKAQTERNLGRSSHQARKKIRETKEQLRKVESRRQRIFDESDLTPADVKAAYDLEQEQEQAEQDPTVENHSSL